MQRKVNVKQSTLWSLSKRRYVWANFGTEIEKCRWQVAYFVTSQIKMIKNWNEWCVPISCTAYNNSTKKSHFSTLRSERVTLSNQRYMNFHAKKVLKKTHTNSFLNTNAALRCMFIYIRIFPRTRYFAKRNGVENPDFLFISWMFF